MTHQLLGTLFLFSACSLVVAQNEEKKDQPLLEKGSRIPASFDCFQVNGPAKGRPACFTCRAALAPAVLIFAHEPEEGKDEVFNDLLKQLDEVAADFEDRYFTVGVVFLSADGRDSTNNAQPPTAAAIIGGFEKNISESAKRIEKQAKVLIEENVKREKLVGRLTKRAEPLKKVVLAYHAPELPKGYYLDKKADLTVIFYERLRVREIHSFERGTLQAENVKKIVENLREALPLKKKAVEE